MHFGLPVVPDEYRMYSGWSKGSEAKDAAPPLTPNSCQRLARSEEHTSELQSRLHLVCRLLLEKKKPPCRCRRGVRFNLVRPENCPDGAVYHGCPVEPRPDRVCHCRGRLAYGGQ